MSEQTSVPDRDVCPETTGNGCFDHACDTTCKTLRPYDAAEERAVNVLRGEVPDLLEALEKSLTEAIALAEKRRAEGDRCD